LQPIDKSAIILNMGFGVFVGLSTVDVVYAVEALPEPNSKVVASHQEISAGGPATNAAITYAHLGGESRLITAVGRHPLTAIIKRDFAHFNVSLEDLLFGADDLPLDDEPAVSSIAVTEKTGDRAVISVNATHLRIPPQALDTSRIDHASILLVDGHHMDICTKAATHARSKGIPVVLDGGSWKDGTNELLSAVDIAVCSEDFLPPQCQSRGSVIEYLIAFGVSAAAVTAGHKPIRYASRTGSGEIPVPAVRVADTLGAGDIFHGAFCYYYAANGGHFRDALERASLVASRSCEHFGTRSWMKV